ncbi:asparagine synthase (glutamine-hydrolyzing) [Povalibacter uvarum]|uniref:asparagine synthase (glutamine-hydrolyzing) n=1 Tax=Povalibacter uvarum TaxID=732238 RepID=A0A841HEW2_9GAMM|nr:asparagine synthase C-terminal domain-containing protein [Povalibacter uvarum]MBB6091223.1 asparagine synthase (glutamine-hydrolyzing) [Povalibacter uvarum]
MFRYLAFIYEPSSPVQSRFMRHAQMVLSAHQQWSAAAACNGLQVWSAGGHPSRLHAAALPGEAGVVLGSVFRRLPIEDPEPAPRAHWTEPLAAELVQTRGDLLLTYFWGNYVAVLNDRESGSTFVLKDPTGDLPCIQCRQSDVTILFSHVADCELIGLHPFTLRRAYLSARVLGNLDPRESPFHDVTPVLPGMRLEIRRGVIGQTIVPSMRWWPQTFCSAEQRIEQDGAAQILESTLRSCTLALAQGHEHPLVELSGGLDSSLISACLAALPARQRPFAYTYFDLRAISDERPWARRVADHLGLEYQAFGCDPRGVRLEPLESLQKTFEPVYVIAHLQGSTVRQTLVQDRGSTAVFTGIGGDSILGSHSLTHTLSDYFSARGPGPRTFALAAQLARCRNLTVWHVLHRSLRRWLLGSTMAEQRSGLTSANSIASAETRRMQSQQRTYPHPWFEHQTRVPWSLIRRLGSLLYSPQFYDASVGPDEHAAETLSPLYSQPVVELCLRIPLYVHFDGGRDRGLARRAFEAHLPRENLERQWKDRAPDYAEELIRGNRAYVRERLLDGVLVREGLLDRAALEATLSDTPSRSSVGTGEILRHLDAELWLSKWTATSSLR